MSDTPVSPAGNAQAPTEGAPPNMQVLAQFIRDFSFENPRAPQSLRVDSRPEVDVGVEMNAKSDGSGTFEVDLKLSVKAKTPDGPMFHVELVYGGVFQLSNIPEQMLESTLLVECPRYLFPYARRIISDVTSDGGFIPPFYLEPIDFAALYLHQKANANTQGQA